MQNLFPFMKNNKTKQAIIEAIADAPGSTLKEIHAKIRKENTISYQAVHKAVNELQSDGILENSKQIKITHTFLENLESFLSLLKQKTINSDLEGPNSRKYQVNSFAEAGKLVIQLAYELENPEHKICLCLFRHSWPLFGMTKTDYEILEKTIKENTFFELIKGNTTLDFIFAKPLEEMGKLIVHNAKTTAPFDIIIKGDYVQQVVFPIKVIDKLDDIYMHCKNLEDLSIVNLLKDFVVEKQEIIVKVVKDKELADSIREQALKEATKFDINNKLKLK